MELILFIGIQAAGKSSFYREMFFRTHVRLNLDMLRTRHREQILVEACLAGKTKFVVDNTNLSRDLRARFIVPAKAAGFQVIGYYFKSDVDDSLRRNADRPDDEFVPEIAIYNAARQQQPPTIAEGFDKLFTVGLASGNQFIVRERKK